MQYAQEMTHTKLISKILEINRRDGVVAGHSNLATD